MTAPYFVVDEVAGIMTEDPDNTEFNKLIEQEGPYADKDLENDLYAWSAVAPPYEGDDLTADLKGAANWKTAERVFSIKGRKERAEAAKAMYMQIIGLNKNPATQEVKVQGGIIGRIKAQYTTRTKPLLVAEDPRNSKVPLPTQSSIYAFDDFA